jgi:hypothetical protein
MNNSKTLLIITVIVVPVFFLALAIAGIFVGFGVTSAVTANNDLGGAQVDRANVEAEVLNIAADYAGSKDLQTARERLSTLGLPNAEQYISFMVDRYLQESGKDNADTQNLFLLADALGASTESMIAALSSPTPTPTLTPIPTATPLPTDTPIPSPTPIPPTNTPLPTAPPVAEVPTDTPIPPTPVPGPPTNTPEPTATPEPPKPAVDYVVAEAYLIPNPSYGGCPGAHSIFVTVVDMNGTPMDGVIVEDTGHVVPPKVSGEKGPGKVEYDLWKNGFSLLVTKNSDGSPASSDVTPKLSSVDEDIPNEWLVQANYCRDMNDCVQRKSNNQLCRGHYAYNVTFKKTH